MTPHQGKPGARRAGAKGEKKPGKGAARAAGGPAAGRRGEPLNVHEAKATFSSLIDRVIAGETVVICRRNVPVAEVRPISPVVAKTPRPIGLAAGELEVPASFDDPLPVDVQGAFEGRGP